MIDRHEFGIFLGTGCLTQLHVMDGWWAGESLGWRFLESSLGFLNNSVHLLCRVRVRAKTNF